MTNPEKRAEIQKAIQDIEHSFDDTARKRLAISDLQEKLTGGTSVTRMQELEVKIAELEKKQAEGDGTRETELRLMSFRVLRASWLKEQG